MWGDQNNIITESYGRGGLSKFYGDTKKKPQPSPLSHKRRRLIMTDSSVFPSLGGSIGLPFNLVCYKSKTAQWLILKTSLLLVNYHEVSLFQKEKMALNYVS